MLVVLVKERLLYVGLEQCFSSTRAHFTQKSMFVLELLTGFTHLKWWKRMAQASRKTMLSITEAGPVTPCRWMI